MAMRELHFSRYRNDLKLSHYLFRFPAKFHPPAARCLLERFSAPGNTVLDPFCGSGTLLVEARVSGRTSIGLDVDPLSVFISRVKARPLSSRRLERGFDRLQKRLAEIRRSSADYDRFIHSDLDQHSIKRLAERFHIPNIPNLSHWFRTYVAIDLARLRCAILECDITEDLRAFFLACFASTIRNASNADPVPVSGLEVTRHMRERDERGRRIDPFALFEIKVRREMAGMNELHTAATDARVRVLQGDARSIARLIPDRSIDSIITSPPYNTAVDYYRRHTLEMYWLGLVHSHDERLALARKYVGREQVRLRSWYLRWHTESAYLKRLLEHAARVGPNRERALRHYCASMDRTLRQMARVLKAKAPAVIVVGNAKWNGRRVRATRLIEELAGQDFRVQEKLTYSTANRYMSYSRHNGANVNREYVVVLRRR